MKPLREGADYEGQTEEDRSMDLSFSYAKKDLKIKKRIIILNINSFC